MITKERERAEAFDQYCDAVGARTIRDLISALQEDASGRGMLDGVTAISVVGEQGELRVIGRLAYNPRTAQYSQDGVVLNLTRTEHLVLELLTDNAGRTVTVEEFMKKRGFSEIDPALRRSETGSFKVFIHRLRRTLGDQAAGATMGRGRKFQIITSERGGYQYNPTYKQQDILPS